MPKHNMTVANRKRIVALFQRIVDNEAPASFVPIRQSEVAELYSLTLIEARLLKQLLRVWLDYRLPTD